LIGLRDILDLRKTFASQSEIRQAVADKYVARRENFADAGLLLIFTASQQRTWLVATQGALYLVTDRLKEDAPKALWRLDRADVMRGNSLDLPIRVDPNTERTGKVTIGGKGERVFSKDLFTDVPIDQRIQTFVEKAFGDVR